MTTTPTLADVAALNAAVLTQDAVIVAARDAMTEITSRRSTLVERMSALQAAPPTPPADHSASAIDLLVADPSATIDAADLTTAAEMEAAFRASMDAWRAEVSLVERGLAALDAAIGEKEAAYAASLAARGPLWQAFVRGAYAHLMAELGEQLGGIAVSLMQPLDALRRETDNSRPLVGSDAPYIDHKSSIILHGYVERTKNSVYYDDDGHVVTEPVNYMCRTEQRLFPSPEAGRDVLDRFRASLSDAQP